MRTSVRLTKYFLRRWYRLDKNISDLDENEKVNARILYGSLKNLTPDERKFLADKYRVAKKPHRNDREMAEEYGMGLQAYIYKRVKIEEKLSPYIVELRDKYQEDAPLIIDKKTFEKRLKKKEIEKEEFIKMMEERARGKYQLLKNEL